DPVGAEVGEGYDAATLAHDRGEFAGDRNEAEGTGFQGDVEALAGGFQEPVVELGGRGVGDAVDEDIQLAVVGLEALAQGGHFIVVADIALVGAHAGNGFGQLLGVLLGAVINVGDGDIGTGVSERGGDLPGDTPLVL